MKIVSGGQSGADRAALDAALALGIPCGGWCPKGRLAENGPIPARYPLTEMESASYADRTRQNVQDSDGTAIVSFGPPRGGSEFTLQCCRELGKPCIVIDASVTPIAQAIERLSKFVMEHRVRTLNVAGPRASEQPGIYAYVYDLVQGLGRQLE
jgi:hypothetical protein